MRASAHWVQDFVLTEQGDLRTGAHARREALRGFEAVGDRWGLGMSPARRRPGPFPAGRVRPGHRRLRTGSRDQFRARRGGLPLPQQGQARARSGCAAATWTAPCGTSMPPSARPGSEAIGVWRPTILFSLADLHRRSGDLERADQTLDRLEPLVHRLPFPEEMARDLIAGTRMENRLAEGAAAQARELLPRAVRGYFARGRRQRSRLGRGAAGRAARAGGRSGAARPPRWG